MYRQFIIFSAVGAIGTSFHFFVLIALVGVTRTDPVLASSAGYVTGAVVNYCLNRIYTFKSTTPHFPAALKFTAIALVGMGINTLVMAIVIRWMHHLLSQAIATSIVLGWNYFCNRYWTFREASCERQ